MRNINIIKVLTNPQDFDLNWADIALRLHGSGSPAPKTRYPPTWPIGLGAFTLDSLQYWLKYSLDINIPALIARGLGAVDSLRHDDVQSLVTVIAQVIALSFLTNLERLSAHMTSL